MKTWEVKDGGKISGVDLVDAIKRNLGDLLVRSCNRPMPPELVDCVLIRYNAGIIGGRGGTEVEFVGRRPEGKVRYNTMGNVAWIYADKDDLPDEQVEIRGLKF